LLAQNVFSLNLCKILVQGAVEVKKFVVLCIVGLSILVARHAITADSPTTPKTAAAPEKAASLANLNPAQIPAAERFPWQPKELVAVVGSHRFRHWGTVTSVAFSPNGGRVASGGSDGYIRFWDTAGQETAALKTPDWSVNCIAYSPGRRMLLAGGEKGVVFVWKLGGAAPEELPSLVPSPSENPNPIHVGTAIDAIEFSADGKFLACSVGRQANVRVVLWDTSSWPPRELPSLAEATAPFAFAADSKTFYTQHGQGGIAAWDLTDDRPKKKSTGQLDNPRGQLLTMAVAPSGKRLATCYGDATAGAINLDGKSRSDVVLWDLTVSPPKPKAAFGEFKYDPMFYMLHAAAFSLDSNTLAFANKDRLVELWNVSVDPPKKQATLRGDTRRISEN
jgi:WD40 repeat protein